jgi:hypothetical protein
MANETNNNEENNQGLENLDNEQEKDIEKIKEGDAAKAGGGDDDKATNLTKDDITDILTRVVGEREPEAKPQPERQYTQAEIEQLLNVWKPDASFLKKLGFQEPTEEQLAAVHELRDALVRQANTMSEARFQQIMAEKLGDLDDLRSYVTEQRAQATTQAFYKAHPELEKYEEVVEAVSAKLESSGFKANTRDKVFDEIARSTTAVLSRMGVKLEDRKASKTGAAGNRMSKLASGGQTGGGGGHTPAARKKPDMSIFDEGGEE